MEFYLDGLGTNFTNENLGAHVRAFLVAKEGINAAFQKIETYKTIEPKENIKNPAR